MPFDENRRPVKTLTETPVLLGAISEAVAGDGGLVDFENFSASPISINSVPNSPATGLISGTLAHYHFTLVVVPTNQTTVDASLAGWSYASQPATLYRVHYVIAVGGATTVDELVSSGRC